MQSGSASGVASVHQPCVEALPTFDGILVGPDGPCQRVIAGREARAHAGDRSSRSRDLDKLPNIEGFRKQFSAPLGFPACSIGARRRRATPRRSSGSANNENRPSVQGAAVCRG